MEKLKTVILDDEFPALKMMEAFVQKTPFLELTGQFTHASEALAFIKTRRPDLVLSDICMPGIDGLSLAAQLTAESACIFLSASPEFALQAYEADVVDYILKPYSYERFLKAVQKAKDYLLVKETKSGAEEVVTIKADYMTYRLPVRDILWVEAFSEYTKVVTKDRNYAVLMRITAFEEQYRHLGFVRIHRSYIIPRHALHSYSSDKVTLTSGQILPVGRKYREMLKE